MITADYIDDCEAGLRMATEKKRKTIKKLPITEADITKQIRDYLNYKNIFHWKQWQGPMSQPRGVSDIIGIINGKFFAIEIKKPRGQPTDHQINFMASVRSAGGIAFVAYGIEEVQKELMI